MNPKPRTRLESAAISTEPSSRAVPKSSRSGLWYNAGHSEET